MNGSWASAWAIRCTEGCTEGWSLLPRIGEKATFLRCKKNMVLYCATKSREMHSEIESPLATSDGLIIS